MKLSRFLVQAQIKGGTMLPPEIDPLPRILTRIGMNRYSVESQALIRVCLAVIGADKEADMVKPDLWALGSDARSVAEAQIQARITPR